MKGSTARLVELVRRVSNWDPRKSPGHEAFPYIDLSSVDKELKAIVPLNVPLVEPADAPSRARQLVQEGDVLVSTVRPNLNGVALVDSEFDGATASTGYCVLRPDPERLDSKYLFYWVQTPRFIEMMIGEATGANYPAVSDRIIKASELPLPALAEQKRIATILDKASALRRKRYQAIELADQFLRSVFLEMFGGPAKRKSIAELLREDYLLLHKDGNHGSNYPRKEEFGEKGVPFISAKDISDDDGSIDYGAISYLSEKKARTLKIGWLKKGDVLLAHNATVGRVGVFEGNVPEALIGTSLTAYRPNLEKIASQYLFCALKYSDFQTQLRSNMSQSTRNQVPITAQKELTIPVPDLDRQRAFGVIFDRTLRMKKNLCTSMADCELMMSSLSQKAFTTEI